MNHPARRLQRRLMVALAGFVVLTAVVFGLYALVFMYAVEDAFFDAMLEHEAAVQLRGFANDGRWQAPRDPGMSLHSDLASLPPGVASVLATEPQRNEFPGDDGRHYHLRAIDPPAPAARVWLLAEVSGQLVVRPMRERIGWLLAISGGVIVVFAVLAGALLARRTTAPLSRLALQVDGIAPERLPPALAQQFGDDEVGMLARGLDGLVARVRAFVAREQAFTRDASHELRTPLAVIRNAAERLLREPGLSDAGRAHLGHIRSSASQLEHVVTMLLALAREEHAATPASPQRLLPMLERVIVDQAPLLDGKPIDVALQVTPEACITLPVPVLQVLLSNLVGNAFAHAHDGTVTIDVLDGRLRIANRVAGDGLARRWQTARPFAPGDGSSGWGLGLTIVRRLCDRHAIDLRFDDGNDGASIASIAIDADAMPSRGNGTA